MVTIFKFLLSFLIIFNPAYGGIGIQLDRWVTPAEASAWTCPASQSLVKPFDECADADCVYVPVAPCGLLEYKTTHSMKLSSGPPYAIQSLNYPKMIVTDDWGTNGQVMTSDGTKGNWENARFAGEVFTFAGITCPNGTMLANGAAISRTTYANLFTAIGTVWGAGDGSTTFNIPDLRNQFMRGAGTGAVGTSELDTTAKNGLSNSNLGSHAHASVSNHTHASTGSHYHGSGAWDNFAGNLGPYTLPSAKELGQYESSPFSNKTIRTTSDGNHQHSSAGGHSHSSTGNHAHTISGDTETRPDNYRVNFCVVVI